MTTPLLDVRNLSIAFDVKGKKYRAVDHVSFSMEAGETVAIVGESGCGKTMTALSLLRLIPDGGSMESGEILLQGTNLVSLSASKMREVRGKEIAMIFQEPMTSLNPVFTVGEQIAEAIRIHRKQNRSRAKSEAIEAMRRVQIPAPELRYDDYPHQLSGGMRQRIMIAIALACDPRLLIADEPTTALDVTIQLQILELLREIQRERKMSILLITHDLGVVAEVADRVLVMYAGEVVESATVEELFSEPLHPYTRALYRSLPSVDTKKDRLQSIPGRVPTIDAIPAHCRFLDRCPDAQDLCKEPSQALREIRPHHYVRCRRAA